ncbi:hypothetical protein F5Y15DRAFT_301423 [Xylariaceae sp. FL0016]|nr:hypothetical protein F5Y15DRAFT_301423 [Xylariaceae sp. FL0016]
MGSLGSLTTTFTPPPACSGVTDSLFITDVDTLHFNVQGPISTGECFPENYKTDDGAYYSPGVCPSGYSAACTNLFTQDDTVTETRYTCCPTKYAYTCQYNGHPGFGGCFHDMPTTAWTQQGLWSINDGASSLVNITGTAGAINAHSIQVRIGGTSASTTSSGGSTSSITSSGTSPTAISTSTDAAVAVTAAETATTTPSSTGLSPAARAGLGIGVALGIIALGLAVIFLFVKKRRRRPAGARRLSSERKMPNNYHGGTGNGPNEPVYGQGIDATSYAPRSERYNGPDVSFFSGDVGGSQHALSEYYGETTSRGGSPQSHTPLNVPQSPLDIPQTPVHFYGTPATTSHNTPNTRSDYYRPGTSSPTPHEPAAAVTPSPAPIPARAPTSASDRDDHIDSETIGLRSPAPAYATLDNDNIFNRGHTNYNPPSDFGDRKLPVPEQPPAPAPAPAPSTTAPTVPYDTTKYTQYGAASAEDALFENQKFLASDIAMLKKTRARHDLPEVYEFHELVAHPAPAGAGANSASRGMMPSTGLPPPEEPYLQDLEQVFHPGHTPAAYHGEEPFVIDIPQRKADGENPRREKQWIYS